ncbi:MAG: FAD/NAD(P)-binding protein [Candidatus Hydrogenedentes bacterium]|nr:FAD/NAD(P)-binding protein [Candidatus Hydrogenedentota bacterium]
MKNPYSPIQAQIEEVIEETPTDKTFVIRPETPISFKAGQFMQLTVPGVGEAPFTPSSSPAVTEKMDITILKTGTVTDALHAMKAGDMVGLRGPFGKGYPMEKFANKEVLLVGGGVGLAPLRALILAMFEDMEKYKRLSIKYGAKAPEELLYRASFDEWSKRPKTDLTVTIDVPAPGWTGTVGLVTTLLDDVDVDKSNSYVVACGPAIMLRFVTYKLLEIGFQPEQIYLSMNRKMSCGIGKCGRCEVGPYYVCQDGPDMNYAEVKDVPNLFS